MNNWYDTEDWYLPSSLNTDALSTSLPDGKKPSRKKGRVIGITVLTALLSFSAGFLFFAARSLRSEFTAEFGGQSRTETAELPDDYKDFFDSYYTTVSSKPVEVKIPAAEESYDFSPELESIKGEELTLQELYKRSAPSVVAIEGFEDGVTGYTWGTGVILTQDGLILTNTHVLDGCDRAEVILPDDSKFEAKLLGADSVSDLAVLKIEASDLPTVEFGESAGIAVGDKVAAIGNPLGDSFARTLTDGIISAIDRDVSFEGRTMTLLQTNTALNEGNSGGALFNMYGQVIGITNMKMMSAYSSIEGIGFAIPSATVKSVVASLVKYGEVKGRPSIGITVGQIPETISDHYEIPEGVYVAAVSEGSDAAEKGIAKDDVIVAVNGVSITSPDEVNDIKNQLSVGDEMTFSIWREGETMEITITLMDTIDIYG